MPYRSLIEALYSLKSPPVVSVETEPGVSYPFKGSGSRVQEFRV